VSSSFYQADKRQLRSVMLYGTPEKSSVDLLLIILQKVGTGDRKRKKAMTFPEIPKMNFTISSMSSNPISTTSWLLHL